jgi:PAS domain S-box-containing protein
LKLFFGSGDWLVGLLSLRKADGSVVEFPCKGCVVQRPSHDQASLVAIQLDQRMQFQAVSQKIDELNAEIRHRRQAEEQLRERSAKLEQEITERKKAEEVTRAALQYSRSLIEASLDPLVTISAEGKITDVNRATESVTGRSRSELIGTDFSDYFTAPDKAREVYQQVFANGFITDYPLVLRHRGGHVTEVLYNANVYCNEAGEVLGVFAAARDVTERNKAEQEVAQLSFQNRLILDSAGEGIYGLDIDGRCTFVNPAALQLLGFKVEELIGQHGHPKFHHTRPDGCPYPAEECPVQAAYKQGEIHRGDDLYWRKDGSSFPVEFISTPILEAGKITGAVVAFRDITERKKTEKELRRYKDHLEEEVSVRTGQLETANKELEGLVYSISHDLRVPLRAIDGFSQQVLKRYEDKLDDEGKHYLNVVRENTKKMSQLIDDILAFSRTERLGYRYRKSIWRSWYTRCSRSSNRALPDVNSPLKSNRFRFVMATRPCCARFWSTCWAMPSSLPAPRMRR